MSKRKANNPQRRLERLGRAALRGCAIIFVAGNDGLCQMLDMKTGKTFNPGLATSKTIETGRYTWSVYCAVFCRDQNNKEYMQSVVITTKDHCLQSDLVSVLHEHHAELINGCNPTHTLNVGWLASPVGHEWTDKEAAKIFTKMDAWNFSAKWEQVA